MKPIEVSRHDTDIAIVTLHREHDLTTRDELEETLRSLLRSGEQIVVDVSEVEFIDSSVLNNFLMADRMGRACGSTFTLQLATAPGVRTALEVSGLLQLLPHAPSREEAVRLARRAPRACEGV